jgi:hypothetical protein
MMTDRRRELFAEEDAAWLGLDAIVDGLGPDLMTQTDLTPEGWSVKDLLAHLAAWMAEAACQLERVREGTYRVETLDVEAMNAEFYEANKDLPVNVVRAELHAARTRMLTELDALPELSTDAEEWFIESGVKHYGEHLLQLAGWAGRHGSAG